MVIARVADRFQPDWFRLLGRVHQKEDGEHDGGTAPALRGDPEHAECVPEAAFGALPTATERVGRDDVGIVCGTGDSFRYRESGFNREVGYVPRFRRRGRRFLLSSPGPGDRTG